MMDTTERASLKKRSTQGRVESPMVLYVSEGIALPPAARGIVHENGAIHIFEGHG